MDLIHLINFLNVPNIGRTRVQIKNYKDFDFGIKLELKNAVQQIGGKQFVRA